MSLQITECPSPNHEERRAPIDMLLLHYTGMETGEAARARLCDANAKVSAHYIVEEDGRVLRLVPEERRAWHAGVASWGGQSDINSCSIGIEIVNGGHDFGYPDFADPQIAAVSLGPACQSRDRPLGGASGHRRWPGAAAGR